MGKFIAKRTLSLNFLGPGWEDCFLTFSSMSWNETKAIVEGRDEILKDKGSATDRMLLRIKQNFLEGKGFDGKNVVDITPDDLGDLPTPAVTALIRFVSEVPDPNASPPSSGR